MQILVLNCGSSSLKWAVLDPTQPGVTASGLVEKIGADTGFASAKFFGLTPQNPDFQTIKLETQESFDDHATALQWVASRLREWSLLDQIGGVGHRVVHGAEAFSASTLLSPEVLAKVQECTPLAPLHNPANLVGIQVAQELFPNLPQVGVFDTAFHQSLPPKAYHYALPATLYREHGVRRYGFHGSSHRFVASAASELLDQGPDVGLVILHLGNGCSGSAVWAGQSLDTTMGLTPLEGLVMGTRSGDLDPGIAPYLQARLGWTLDKINSVYNKESGLLGLSELSNDMRSLAEAEAQGHQGAALARDVFCYRAAKAAAALAVALPQWDALVFTGGIGENAADIRARIVAELKVFGLELNSERNSDRASLAQGGSIASPKSSRAILVIPTDEERRIALDTLEQIQGA